MVVEHRDHLHLLLASGVLEESRLVVAAVIDVRAGQRQVLEDEHACFVSLPIEVPRQYVGDHAKSVDVGLLCGREVRREDIRPELVEPVCGRVARAAQKHGSPIDRKAPAARADIP